MLLDFSISQLNESVKTDSFCCGDHDIDEWFTRRSLQQHVLGTTRVYVCQSVEGDIVGFYTMSSHYLQRRTFSDESRQNFTGGNIPAILLGMLGVSESFKDSGIGHYLVEQAKFMAVRSSEISAARFLYVQARSDSLIDWYKGQGFIPMPNNTRNMIFDLQSLDKIS